MRLPKSLTPIPFGTLLLLATAVGCQSVSRSASEISLLAPSEQATTTTLTRSSLLPQKAAKPPQGPAVRLTGLVTEDPASEPDPSPNSVNGGSDLANPSEFQSAAGRNVRPVYTGQSGLRDPNAEFTEQSLLRQTGGETPVEPAGPGKPNLLFGNDPTKLFRSLEPQDPEAAPPPDPSAASPWDASQEPSRLPPLITPAPETTTDATQPSPYEQALNSNSDSHSFGSDIKQIFPVLWDDTKSLFTWQNAAVITVAAGGAVAIRETGVDNDVRNYTLGHEKRWGSGTVALRQFGEPAYQVPVIAALYGYSLWKQDSDLHDYSTALVFGYSLNALSTVAIKGVVDSQRPSPDFSDGRWGFPSFHVSSIYSIGGVTEEYYGWQAGVPFYILGGLVGWSRIDQREHDLSDVVFGAALGYVIGRTIGAHHRVRDAERKWNIQPYCDPVNGSNGVSMERRF